MGEYSSLLIQTKKEKKHLYIQPASVLYSQQQKSCRNVSRILPRESVLKQLAMRFEASFKAPNFSGVAVAAGALQRGNGGETEAHETYLDIEIELAAHAAMSNNHGTRR